MRWLPSDGSARSARTRSSSHPSRALAAWLLTAAVCLGLGACASPDTPKAEQTAQKPSEPLAEPPSFPQPSNRPADAAPEARVKASFATFNPQASTVFPDYRLNVSDVIEVIYFIRTDVTSLEYRIKTQDLLSINFPFQRELNQDATVGSDGKIWLLLIGGVTVIDRGKTGISKHHFRQDPKDHHWEQFNPDAGKWDVCAYNLVRTSDGAWMKHDPAGTESPLEDFLGVASIDKRLPPPYIIDVMAPGDRYDRYEYDHDAQRWKTLPKVVEQVGLTAGELRDRLREEYGKYMKNPELTVSVRQSNSKIAELKVAITTAPRGQSRLMPVKPDGTIDVPFVGEVMAFGKTIQQLKIDIESAYSQVDLPEISVTVQINEWAPQKVFVLGEVLSPGLLTIPTSVTLLQALAAAGGTNPRASMEQIMVIRRKGLPIPEAVVLNLRQVLGKGQETKAGQLPDFSDLRYDFYMADGDIVYVPSSALAQTGDWVDMVFSRIIRNIIPYNFYTGLNFGYELHNQPSKVTTKSGGGGPPKINLQAGP